MVLINISLLVGSIYSIINPESHQRYLSHLYYTYDYGPYLSSPNEIKGLQFNDYKFEFEDNKLPEYPVSEIDITTIDGVPALFEFIVHVNEYDILSYYYIVNAENKLINYDNDDGTVPLDYNFLQNYKWEDNIKKVDESESVNGVILIIEMSQEIADQVNAIKDKYEFLDITDNVPISQVEVTPEDKIKPALYFTNEVNKCLVYYYYVNQGRRPVLKYPNRLERFQFNEIDIIFDSSASLPHYSALSLDIITCKHNYPVLINMYQSNEYTFYSPHPKTGKWSNYIIDGLDKYQLTNRNGVIYYKTEENEDNIKLFQFAYREPSELPEDFCKEHKSSYSKLVINESLELDVEFIDLADIVEDDSLVEDDFKQLTELEEGVEGAEIPIKSLIYTGEGYSAPFMKIQSAYDQSIVNFKNWYKLQLNPKDNNSLIIEENNPKYVSEPHYPLVSKDSANPAIDFSIQYVHPSVRKYLYNVNNPSYYYLYKESLANSHFSEFAKKLLYPNVFEAKLYADVDSNVTEHKNISEQEVPVDYLHAYEASTSPSFIGISINSGGIFYPYYLGALSLLSEYNIVTINTTLLGASAGCIAATKLGMGMDFYEAMGLAESVIGDYTEHGLVGRMSEVLGNYMREKFPYDAHQFLSERIGKIITCYTVFKPVNKIEHVSKYYNKDDLIESILASTYFPKFSDKNWTGSHRGQNAIDGGVLPYFDTHKYPHSGSIRTIYLSSYCEKRIHERCGFNNVISQYNYKKNKHVEFYLLLKSVQSRLLLIKYKLRDSLDEWKNLIDSIIFLFTGTVGANYTVIENYMTAEDLLLIKKLLSEEKKLDDKEFMPKLGLLEWLHIEQQDFYLPSDIDTDKSLLDKIKTIIKSADKLDMSTDVLVFQKLVSIISQFLIYVFPPMNLTYYYTKTPTILHVNYTNKGRWYMWFHGNSKEGTRSLFDHGRASAYRWLIMEYILMENYLYNKYKFCLRKLIVLQAISDLDYTFSYHKPEPSSTNVTNCSSGDFHTRQMSYIIDILNHFSTNKNVKNSVNNTDKTIKEELDWLFVKRNDIVKKAIEIELLDNTDFTHILTHTHHWLKSQ